MSRNRGLSLAAVGAVTALGLAGCAGAGSGPGTAKGASSPAATATSPSPPATPTQGPAGSASPTPSPTPTKPKKPKKLKAGDDGPAVEALQGRLRDLGYWLGKPDGNFGELTTQAVYALQKAAGIDRDGIVGKKTREALEDGERPKAKSDSGYVIEIDKKKQLLLVVDDGEIEQIFNTSTGSGEVYESEGQVKVAGTPEGSFRVYRSVDGWDKSPLGRLYRPKYFNGGIAVHGYLSVPPYPASHGCVRVSVPAMDWFWRDDRMDGGTRVVVR